MPSLFPTAKSDPELAPFRPGLTFSFFNALAWQIGIGTPMVLFAEQLGASPFQVGLAYSFVFILMPVQILATALLPRYGYKAVMLGGWRTRSFFLAVPLVLSVLAMRGTEPWMVGALVGSVFFFCFFRSIGAASGLSWFYAILPERVRGRYFASDQFVAAVAGVGTLLICAGLFAVLPVYVALLGQYVIALGGSIVSYFALRQLPDAPRPPAKSLGTVLRDTPRQLFVASPFRHYLWLAVVFTVIVTPIPPFAAYYLKVGPRLSGGQIMLFEVFRFSGVMTAAWLIRRRIDVTGAKPFFVLALGLYGLVGAFWWVFLFTGGVGLGGIAAAYFLTGLAAATWAVASLNYLPKVLSAEVRPFGVAVFGAITAFIGGLSPIVWGIFLRNGAGMAPGIDRVVFEWFFVTLMVGAAVLSSLLARLPEDNAHPVEPLLIGNALFRPFRAAMYLVNLVEPQWLMKEDPQLAQKAAEKAKSGKSENRETES